MFQQICGFYDRSCPNDSVSHDFESGWLCPLDRRGDSANPRECPGRSKPSASIRNANNFFLRQCEFAKLSRRERCERLWTRGPFIAGHDFTEQPR